MSEPLKDPFPATSPDTVTVLEVNVKERVAPMMRVVCHDDPYTTMEFVVGILTGVFRLPHARAVEIMLEVHQRGAGDEPEVDLGGGKNVSACILHTYWRAGVQKKILP